MMLKRRTRLDPQDAVFVSSGKTPERATIRNPSTRSLGSMIEKKRVRTSFLILLLWWIVTSINSNSHDTEVNGTNGGGIDAVVTIAAKGFGSAMLISSLVNVGLWNGPIYVLTNSLKKQKDVATRFNATLIDIESNHPTFLSKEELVEYRKYYDTVNREFWVKWHKTQIFELLPNVQTVLYVDADITLQKPIHEFLRDVRPLLAQNDCQIYLYPERWYRNLRVKKLRYEETGRYNSGIMVLDRIKSRNILQHWSSSLVKKPFGKRDQPKLSASIDSLNLKVCQLPKRLRHVLFEPDIVDRVLNRWWHLRTFRHMTSRKNVKHTWNAMPLQELS